MKSIRKKKSRMKEYTKQELIDLGRAAFLIDHEYPAISELKAVIPDGMVEYIRTGTVTDYIIRFKEYSDFYIKYLPFSGNLKLIPVDTDVKDIPEWLVKSLKDITTSELNLDLKIKLKEYKRKLVKDTLSIDEQIELLTEIPLIDLYENNWHKKEIEMVANKLKSNAEVMQNIKMNNASSLDLKRTYWVKMV